MTASADLADQPLHPLLKLTCFLCPDFGAVIIAWAQAREGRKRGARDAWRFFRYGWLLRLAIVACIVLAALL
jgi:hypothetical protein